MSAYSVTKRHPLIKGAPPIAADPGEFPDFRMFVFFEKCRFGRISQWDLGSGRVCNRLEMAVGFKWTDSQPILSYLSSFSMIFMISVVLLPFHAVQAEALSGREITVQSSAKHFLSSP